MFSEGVLCYKCPQFRVIIYSRNAQQSCVGLVCGGQNSRVASIEIIDWIRFWGQTDWNHFLRFSPMRARRSEQVNGLCGASKIVSGSDERASRQVNRPDFWQSLPLKQTIYRQTVTFNLLWADNSPWAGMDLEESVCDFKFVSDRSHHSPGTAHTLKERNGEFIVEDKRTKWMVSHPCTPYKKGKKE